MSKFEKDLSEGNVVKQLILFSLPFLVSNIVQSLYSVVDLIIVGNVNGTISISGVNIGSQITFILTNIIAGLCTGGTVLIAQYLGAKDRKGIKETIATLVTVLLLSSVVVTVVMLIFRNPLLHLMKTPEESYSEASNYLVVTTLGIVFIFGYNALSAIMRGMGDSKRPFYFVLIACVVNIVLDFVFVSGFKMGAMGAAIATVISQAISMILCVIYLMKNDFIFDFKFGSYKLYKGRTSMLFKVGLPTAVQNGVVGISFLVITTIANTISVDASAAVGLVGKFNGFAILPAAAMSASIGAMSAQNIGAGQWERAVKTLKAGMVVAIAFSWSIFVVSQLFPEPIIKIFDSTNPALVECGVEYLRVFCFDYLLIPIVFSFNGLFIGAGHTTFSLISGVLSSLGLRVPAVLFFGITLDMGLKGIALGAPIATFGSLILVIIFFISKKWRVSKVVAYKEEV